ncbi:MAG: hypothetical protein MZU95_05485 [Desulfomicrobium escambiense]|nr:hypothetical protein [Desulfomicrobium escambiense]
MSSANDCLTLSESSTISTRGAAGAAGSGERIAAWRRWPFPPPAYVAVRPDPAPGSTGRRAGWILRHAAHGFNLAAQSPTTKW